MTQQAPATPDEVQRSREDLRDRILARIFEDLVGPSVDDEEINDRPSDRYLTGILYPLQSEILDEEDEKLEVEGGNPDADDDDGVALVSTLKPSAAGISFALRHPKGGHATINARVKCGTYSLVEDPNAAPGSRRRWKRAQHDVTIGPLNVAPGSTSAALASGLAGLELHLQVAAWESETFTVTAALANKNPRGDSRNESEERTFFQCVLEIEPGIGCELIERPSRRRSQDEDERIAAVIYRDARELASGHTCAADWDLREGRVERVRTAWVPKAKVDGVSELGADTFRRIREAGRLRASWLAAASEQDLLHGLRQLVAAYRTWIGEQEKTVLPRVSATLRAQGAENLRLCTAGADRMSAAIDFLSRDAAARRAFQLAQEAMQKQRLWVAGENELEWRPFQLGFQLLTLESLADRSHADRRTMDLLWFPTGGGKTEAYLALTAFILIYRRLRKDNVGDGYGVAVVMRYTLRLLTVQQFQRAAAVICACDVLRHREGDLGEVPFSIGLWVGNGATPATRNDARKSEGAADHRQLTACPACGGSLQWSVPKEGMSVICESKECELSNRSLPVWTIDEDIYAFTPSLVIGTVDKFAQIVRKTDTAALFGRGQHPHHPPDLIVQDELHLISGPLGSMTGLYESVIDELCTAGEAGPKVIGSTATIRRARDQIRALFNRAAYQFPAPGLDIADSGFAVRDTTKPGRLYLGVTTAGRSAKYAVQAVAAALLQSCGAPGPSDDVRDPYWTLVSYFNTLRELGGSLVLMQDDVPITMGQIAARRAEPSRPLAPPRELTSRVTSAEVRDMLDDLTLRVGQAGSIDVLLASSMISVGVDIPRLGLMLVVGQPKTIAEYIQATSRVGRGRVPGLVVGVYNSGRARDRSFFETFRSWHSTLYRDVEATSVTPFAPRAQDKALHAVLVALARHLVPSLRNDPPRLSKANRTRLEELLQPVLARATSVDPVESQSVMSRFKLLLDEWEMASSTLEVYWDDFGKRRSLLISAEQDAAGEEDSESRRALWPTPNSMREVEPTTAFKVLSGLRSKEADHGQQ